MENREWLNGYSALKQVAFGNPFTVPEGYFNGLEERLAAVIKLEELKNKMPLSGFTVPENYFAEMANTIQSRVYIENITNVENDGFIVPENYFEGLTDNIQSRLTVEEALGAEAMGFIVPEHYFDGLSSNIQSRIAVGEALKPESESFAIPENYFEELASQIESRIFLEEALNAEAGFVVPENYFEELGNQIESRVFLEEALNAETGFALPENYFEGLGSQIQSRIFVEGALAGSAEVLGVEDDYFKKLNKAILNKTVNHDLVKRKGVVIKLFSSAAFKYATAACFAIMIGTGIFITEINQPSAVHNRSYLHKQLSKVPVDEIQSYLQLSMDATDTQHTVAVEGLSVNDAGLSDALQDYTDSTQ